MNILPLILALALMLSILTIEKMEKLKNQMIVQKEYQNFLLVSERQVFNKRQKRLFEDYDKDMKQLSFRYLVDKEARKNNEKVAKQYRILLIELMKNLYGEATFFKELEDKRAQFLEEMLNAIEKAADQAPKKLINRVEDITRLDLEDPDLRKAFYHILKGTGPRQKLEKDKETEKEIEEPIKEKMYPSLFLFINYNGKKGTPQIEVQKAPREILKAVFDKDEIVESIIVKRAELAKSKDNGASAAFKNEFMNKRRPGIDDQLLDFKITENAKTTLYD
jgi:hypothetical protein